MRCYASRILAVLPAPGGLACVLQLTRRETRGIAAPLLFEVSDFRQAGDTATRAYLLAIQSSRGARKVQDALQIPAVQDSVGEAGVKEVARSRGVRDANFIGGSIPELATVPSQGAVNTERCADRTEVVLPLKAWKSLEEILLACRIHRKLPGRDRIIDKGQEAFEACGDMVQIGDYRDV